MASQYADQQPAGFKNHIKNVAIVGAGGNVGKFVAEALIKTGKHKVTAISRPDSKNKMPEGLHAIKHVDYDSHQSLVEALKGQEVLAISLSVYTPKGTQERLIDAAVEAGVRYIMPNEWGNDASNKEVGKDVFLGDRMAGIRKHLEDAGGDKTQWISLTCSFWYEFSLAGTELRYGFNFDKKAVTFFDDGNKKINTSTWPQVGRAVAALLSLKVYPDDESDKSPCISQWARKSVYISSFFVSQKDMFASVLRVMGDKEEDWKVSYESSKERYADGLQKMQQGDMSGFGKLLYSRVFYPDKAAQYNEKLENKVLGLPDEDFDGATQEAVNLWKAGGYGF